MFFPITKTLLNEVFPDFLDGGGIFDYLDNYDVPWKDADNVDTDALNMEYHLNYSGKKIVSPMVYDLTVGDYADAVDEPLVKIAKVCFNQYNDKWSHLWDLLQTEYTPLSNYDMTEIETIDRDTTGTQTNSGTDTITSTGTTGGTNAHTGTQSTNIDIDVSTSDSSSNTGTQTATHTGTQTNVDSTENGVAGFNSSTFLDDTNSESTGTRTDNLTDTRTDNLSESTSGSATTDNDSVTTFNDTVTTTGTQSNSQSTSHGHSINDTGSEDVERTLTRSGNIGVTTSQQMAQSEIELRQWLFFRGVYSDLDNVLTLAVFD